MAFRPNPRFNAELKAEAERSASAKAFERTVAERAASAAEAEAPSGPTGRYKESIGVVQQGGKTFVRTNDFAGHLVEFGSVNNEPYAPLRRGARSAGLQMKEQQR